MSNSDDQPSIRSRTRRRALVLDEADRPIPDTDIFDPGPMVAYPPLPVDAQGVPQGPELRQRVRDIRALDRTAAREFTLRTLHAFLVAHRPMDEIARAFGVSIRRVYVWRTELYKRMAAELRQKTPTDLLVEQIADIKRAKAYAWQQASRTNDHADKCRWVNTAMKADSQLADLYARIGLIDASSLKPANDESEDAGGKAGELADLAKRFLNGDFAGKGKKKDGGPISIEQDITGPIDETDYLL